MARISENYDSHNKADLLAEAQARGLDVTTDALKADVVAALQLDDEKPDEDPAPVGDSPEVASLKARIAELEKDKATIVVPSAGGPPLVAEPKRADLDSFNQGAFADRETGEVFYLRINPEAFYGRTHELANNEHFRDLTPESFKARMEKV